MADTILQALQQLWTVLAPYQPPGRYLEVQVDVLLASTAYQGEALKRRVALVLPESGFEVAVLACEDLILHTLIAGPLLDRVDVAALLRANVETLDVPYLRSWAGRLRLETSLQAVWTEALPGRLLRG